MNFRFFTAVALLFVAFILQFSLASSGIFMNFFFAALVAFAFVFPFWELAVIVLFAVFVVNWQPAASPEILIFAFYPFAIFFGKDFVHLQIWLKNLIGIFIGFFVLYGAIAGRAFLYAPQSFLTDLLGGLIFGTVTLLLLERKSF